MQHDEMEKLLPLNKFICHGQVVSSPQIFFFEKNDSQEEGIEFDLRFHYKWLQYKPYKISDTLVLPVQVFRKQAIEFIKHHVDKFQCILVGESTLGQLRNHFPNTNESRLGLILDERRGEIMLLPKSSKQKKE